jgi:hypothetical protein
VFELIQAFGIEMIFLVLYVVCIVTSRAFYRSVGYPRHIAIGEFFVYLGLLKSVLKFFVNFIIGITCRPPQIKLQEFN